MKRFIGTLLALFCACSLSANYERTLGTFAIEENYEGKTVYFILDDGLELNWKIPYFEEHKLFNLPNLEGTRALITAHPQVPSFEILFENPDNKGHFKISYPVTVSEDAAQNLLTVTSVEECPYLTWFYSVKVDLHVNLSDGSQWEIKDLTQRDLVQSHWSAGDRVIVTKNYTKKNTFSIVNLDVSGEYWVDYFKGYGELWFSMRDPRSAEASPAH